MTMMSEFRRIAVLGAGNIGSALIGGILKAGVAEPAQLTATVLGAEHAREVAERFSIAVTAGGNREASFAGAGLVVCSGDSGAVGGGRVLRVPAGQQP